jgi:enediyne biosynthesis protein E4
MGNWLGLRIRQLPPNRDGIGAWIDVKAGDLVTRRQVTVGGGHAGGQLGWIHFGLGDATEAEVRITWPDGGTSQSKPVAANQYVTIDRGTNEAIPWSTLGG